MMQEEKLTGGHSDKTETSWQRTLYYQLHEAFGDRCFFCIHIGP